MKRALSGITPSSSKGLHLGNYLGMVEPAVAFQNEAECFYFIANIHSLNTVHDPKQVQHNTINTYIEFLSLGIDPEKTVFFVESDVPEIPYLQSILNNCVTVAELKRMHAYKDKLQNDLSHDQIGMGLFSYPVLMSADILAFDTDIVPVGVDQAQHVEICREIARTFNQRYGENLKIPELFVKKDTARVLGIYGERKMSKSLGNDIPLFADEKIIQKQIMSIKTDPARIHPTDPGDPSKNVAFSYLKLLNFDTSQLDEMKKRYSEGTIGDVEIKDTLFEVFTNSFAPFREKHQEYIKNSDYVTSLREINAEKARSVATKAIMRVKHAVGF